MDTFPREAQWLLEIDRQWEQLENFLREDLDIVGGIRSLGWGKRYEEKPEDITGPYFMAEEPLEEIVRKL